MPKRKITRVDFVSKIQQLGKAGATKRRKLNNGELPQYYVSQGHPPIIAPSTWDAAQQITQPTLGRMSKSILCRAKFYAVNVEGPMGRCYGTPPLIVIACGNALKRNLENPSVIAAISMMKKGNHQPRSLCNVYMIKIRKYCNYAKSCCQMCQLMI